MSEDLIKADDDAVASVDGTDDVEGASDRPTWFPGETIGVKRVSEGPAIELSGETDLSGMDLGDIDDAVDSIGAEDLSGFGLPSTGDDLKRIQEELGEGIVLAGKVDDAGGRSISEKPVLDIDFSGLFDEEPVVEEKPSVVEDEASVVEELVVAKDEQVVLEPVVTNISEVPVVWEDDKETIPPPAVEIGRILVDLHDQLRKAEIKVTALDEAMDAFYRRNSYCDGDLVEMVERGEIDKVERVLGVHDEFSESAAMALIASKKGLKLMIDHLDSFSGLGSSVAQALIDADLDFGQIEAVLRVLRRTENRVFLFSGYDQVSVFVQAFLVKADLLAERLRKRFG